MSIDDAQVQMLMKGLKEQRSRICAEQAAEAKHALQTQPRDFRFRLSLAERRRIRESAAPDSRFRVLTTTLESC